MYYDHSKQHTGIIAQGDCFPSAFDSDACCQSAAQVQVKPLTKSKQRHFILLYKEQLPRRLNTHFEGNVSAKLQLSHP